MVDPKRIIGFQLRELAGSIPPDHRPQRPGVVGPRAVQSRQIWVDRQTDELWEIVRISAGASTRKFRFVLRRYGGYWSGQRELSWSSLKSGLQVLEDAIRTRRERVATLQHDYANGEAGSEHFPDAASFIRSLGFDPETGFRIS